MLVISDARIMSVKTYARIMFVQLGCIAGPTVGQAIFHQAGVARAALSCAFFVSIIAMMALILLRPWDKTRKLRPKVRHHFFLRVFACLWTRAHALVRVLVCACCGEASR